MSQPISGTYTSGVTLSGNPATIVTTGSISGTTSYATGVYGPGGTGWTLTNQGLVSETGANSYGVSFAASGTIINTGFGTIAGYQSGIRLGGGGSVTNQAGGTISGYYGVKAVTAMATVVNAGSIAGAYASNHNNADGIYLMAGGSVTNQATGNISGRNDGVLITGASGTVVNLGSIHSHLTHNYGGQGISLEDGGVVVNGGPGGTVSAAYIAGYSGGIVFGATGTDTVVNYGTVSGNPGALAISLLTGTVINGASGATGALIESGGANNAVVIGGAGTVVNDGTIAGVAFNSQGNVSYGVSVGGSGAVASSISNLGPNALIYGYVAVYAAQNATVTNSGTLEATQRYGGNAPYDAVIFGGGTNRLIIDPGAVFIGNVVGSGPATLTTGGNTIVTGTANGIGTTTMELASAATAGTLSGLGTQFVGFAAVTIDSGATWTFSGSNTLAAGMTLTDSGTLTDRGTLINAGLITGAATGVLLAAGGRLTNQSGGTIAGSSTGIKASSAATLVNAGLISGNPTIAGDSGLYLAAGGSVTNQSGGSISGYYGIKAKGATMTVVNAGAITGYGSNSPSAGVFLSLTGSGSVTNQSGGVISGKYGVEDAGSSAVTVVNAGTIIGNSDAVKFAAGAADRLVIDPNAVFSGTVTGGNTIGASHVSTLELASAGSAGTLAGLGTKYVDFAQVTVDAGARWTLQATDTIAAGVTLTNAGSLSGTVTLAAGGVLSNASTGTVTASSGPGVYGLTGGAATVVNAGVIAGYAGSGGWGIGLAGGGSVTNRSGGHISGYDGIEGAAAATVVNAGSIVGISGDGVLFVAGGSVTNRSGGTISGYSGITAENDLATVVNAGYIAAAGSAPNAYGVYLGAGGTVTNLATGTISGGIVAEHAPAAVLNYGLVAGEVAGVFLADGGSITNRAGGTISGGEAIVAAEGAAAVDNAGSIIAPGSGVELESGGAVTNQSGGTITGTGYGVSISGANATVDNLGYIDSSAGVGVSLTDGGVITNGTAGATVSSAYIGGYAGGVKFGPANAGTLTNYGTISGLPANDSVQMNTGTVVNGPSGATGALIEAGGGDGVLIKGAGTVINDGQIESDGQGKYYGVNLGGAGVISNLGTASLIKGSVGVYAQLNDTVTNAGTIGSNYGPAGIALAFGGGTNRLIVDPGATFIGTVSGGGTVMMTGNTSVYTIGTANGIGTTTLELASGVSAGTLSGLGTAIVNFSSLVFDAGAQWTVAGNDSASGLGTLAITGFADNDTIDLTGFVAVGDTVTGNALVLTDAHGDQATLNIEGSFTAGSFHIHADGNGGTDVVVCFAAGTLIDTPAGEVRVEKLNVGELVMTAHNGARAVKWIGKGKVLSAPNRRTAATPVIVRKGALGPNVPHQDLRVTKAHSIYIDEVLIPVEFLVNYKTIIWDDRAQEVEIYHVELASHDVLIANGVPAESFRNDGNRWLFQNAYSGCDLPAQEPYAPVLTGGPVVDSVWERLLDRAGRYDLPALTEEADLHLIVDGVRVDATGQSNGAYLFRLKCRPTSVVVGSRAGVPAELGFARDPRRLGVALRRVTIRQGAKFMLIDANDERLAAGFHDYEPAETIRWTVGHAELPIQAFARFDAGAEVAVTLGGSTRYPVVDHRNIPVAA